MYPIKTCTICGEEVELKPDKPGFATHCPDCTEDQANDPANKQRLSAEDRSTQRELNEARRESMKNLLYRKDS